MNPNPFPEATTATEQRKNVPARSKKPKKGDRKATISFRLYFFNNLEYAYYCQRERTWKYPESVPRYTKALGEEELPLFTAVGKVMHDSIEPNRHNLRRVMLHWNLNHGNDINEWLEAKRRNNPQWIKQKEADTKPDKNGNRAKFEFVQNVELFVWSKLETFEANRQDIAKLIKDIPQINVEKFDKEDLTRYILALRNDWKMNEKRGQLLTLWYYYIEIMPQPEYNDIVDIVADTKLETLPTHPEAHPKVQSEPSTMREQVASFAESITKVVDFSKQPLPAHEAKVLDIQLDDSENEFIAYFAQTMGFSEAQALAQRGSAQYNMLYQNFLTMQKKEGRA